MTFGAVFIPYSMDDGNNTHQPAQNWEVREKWCAQEMESGEKKGHAFDSLTDTHAHFLYDNPSISNVRSTLIIISNTCAHRFH